MENKNEKLKRARKRVEQLKGFYVHLAVYVGVNLLIAGSMVIRSGWGTEPIQIWAILSTPVFWGIGLGIHALNVFGINGILGRRWEERQIRKFMEEDRKKAEKFK
ncbi:MAG: 2TM domain-containing protein [Robiginitalea sp.]|nr:2TM domain-containing protein [Robiginitalea sp.]